MCYRLAGKCYITGETTDVELHSDKDEMMFETLSANKGNSYLL
jgi:hypothetical protein